MKTNLLWTVIPMIWLLGMLGCLFYNAYHHNFQLLFVWAVTLLNSLALGQVLEQNKKND